MIPLLDLFEGHLTVRDLSRSMKFYGEVLGLELAHFAEARRIAFYWIGGRGNSMLGLWEAESVARRHLAFRVDLPRILEAPAHLRAVNVKPLDFYENPTDDPVVLAWMPAASLYFHDPDGNLMEFLSMLPDSPRPESGVVSWTQWLRLKTGSEDPSQGIREDT